MAHKTVDWPYPWQPLPQKLKETIDCKKCGQTMELLRVNDNVAFWVHRGEQLAKCKDYAFKTAFISTLAKQMMEKEQHLQKQFMVYNRDGELVPHTK